MTEEIKNEKEFEKEVDKLDWHAVDEALEYLVQRTYAFPKLVEIFERNNVILRDFDGYDYFKLHHSLGDVINDPVRKCGLLDREVAMSNTLG